MAKWTINDWNAQIDRTKTVMRIGLNGIHYEYIMPIYGNPYKYYDEAIDVRSRKSLTSTWSNGKKPGQYQPIGNKSYFTFYQIKELKKVNDDNWYIEMIKEVLSKLYGVM